VTLCWASIQHLFHANMGNIEAHDGMSLRCSEVSFIIAKAIFQSRCIEYVVSNDHRKFVGGHNIGFKMTVF